MINQKQQIRIFLLSKKELHCELRIPKPCMLHPSKKTKSGKHAAFRICMTSQQWVIYLQQECCRGYMLDTSPPHKSLQFMLQERNVLIPQQIVGGYLGVGMNS